MAIRRHPLDIHAEHVRAVEAAGVTPPPEWTALKERITAFNRMATPCRDHLIDAVIAGAPAEDIAKLRAAAFAEPAEPPEVGYAVLHAGYEELCAIYRPHAQANYQKIADKFDKAAAEFSTAAQLVDPDASAESIIVNNEEQRTAWAELPRYAARIDSLIAGLRAAAELTGTSTKRQEAQLALTVDATGLHRRRVWAAWHDTGSRAGRWGALVRLGATIRAATLDGFTEYSLPKPFEEKIERHDGMVVAVTIDPEDAEVAQAPTPATVAKSPKPGSMRL
jgi:hypothetical protein